MAPKTSDPYRAAGMRVVHKDRADFCGHCGKEGSATHRLALCTGCREMLYCNEQCRNAHWKAHRAACRAEQTRIKSLSVENARLYNAFREWTRKHKVMLKMAAQHALIPTAKTLQTQGLLLESHVFRVIISDVEEDSSPNQFDVKLAVVEPASFLQEIYVSRPEEYDRLMKLKKDVMEELDPIEKVKRNAGMMFIVVEYHRLSARDTPVFGDVIPSVIRRQMVEDYKKKTFDGDLTMFLKSGVDRRTRLYADESEMLIVQNAPGTSKSSEAKKSKRKRRAKNVHSSSSEAPFNT